MSLPPECQIEYVAVDMRHQGKRTNILVDLMERAQLMLNRTGFFHSGPLVDCNREGPASRYKPRISIVFALVVNYVHLHVHVISFTIK